MARAFASRRALSVLAVLAAAAGFSAGCGISAANSQAGAEAGSGGSSGSSSSSGGSSGSSGSGGGDSGPPPSCAPGGPGLTNCGASQESCCTSLGVTGGTYDRTYDLTNLDGGGVTVTLSADGGPTGEADPASVSSFRLDKYLVTVGRFRRFVGAWNGGAGYTPPPGSGKHTHLNAGSGLKATGGGYEPGWIATDDGNIAPTNSNLTSSPCGNFEFATWTASAGSQEALPITCVNWWESYAFCIWDGGFLPSEAEWEYAAAGGSQQREYPWGSADPGAANQYAIYSCYYPNGSGSKNCPGVANIAPVGTATLGAGLWGQLDLAGEVWEWNLDWFARAYVNPCADCANLTAASSLRVNRGGHFAEPTSNLIPSYRAANPPVARTGYFGFRCARAP